MVLHERLTSLDLRTIVVGGTLYKLALLASTWEVELDKVPGEFALMFCIPRPYVFSGEHS